MKSLSIPQDQLFIVYEYDGFSIQAKNIITLDYMEECCWPIKEACEKFFPEGLIKHSVNLNYIAHNERIYLIQPFTSSIDIELLEKIYEREFRINY